MKALLTLFTCLCLFNSFGQPWYEIPTGTTNKLNSISFGSNTVGYIAADDSLILKSTDGGMTWNELSYSGINFFPGGPDFISIQFINATTGFITVGPYGGIYKTIDGGSNWTALPQNLCFSSALYFMDEDNGFIGGSGCFQGENIDIITGSTVNSATISTPSWDAADRVVDFDFRGNLGLAVSTGGRILRSTDAGQNWDTLQPGLFNPIVPLTEVVIVNDTLCFAGYDTEGGMTTGFGFMQSNDAGLTWQWNMSTATFFYPSFYSMLHAGDGKVYSGAGTGTTFAPGLIFYVDPNNGMMSNYDQVDQPIYGMDGYDEVVFGVGDSGYVVVNIAPQNIGLTTYENDVTLHLFPNPVQDVLTIQHSFTGVATLTIFNLSGQVMLTAPFSDQEIDVSSLPSGMYFVQLSCEEKQIIKEFVKR